MTLPTQAELDQIFIAVLKNGGDGVRGYVYEKMVPFMSKELDATDDWFYIVNDEPGDDILVDILQEEELRKT